MLCLYSLETNFKFALKAREGIMGCEGLRGVGAFRRLAHQAEGGQGGEQGLHFFGFEAAEAGGYLGGAQGLGSLLEGVAQGLHLGGQLGGPGLALAVGVELFGQLPDAGLLRGRGVGEGGEAAGV